MKSRNIPNIISSLRIVLVAPIVVFLLTGQYQLALVLFLIAGLSDGLDGFLARRFGWMTRLGAILDPLGDKLLMVSCYLVLGWLDQLPVWLVAAVIVRDLVIVTGALLYYFLIETVSMEPTVISKVNTVFQLLLITLVLFSLATLTIPVPVTQTLTYIVFLTTVSSGIGYVVQWGQKAILAKRMEHSHD